MKITPIFILGTARSGTTWLTSVIGSHPQVACAQHPLHHGAHESNIFVNKRYWGDLSKSKNFIKFLELYSSADYFLLVQGDKKFFYRVKPKNFYDFFFMLMDNFAQTQGSNFWVTKFDNLLCYYPRELEEFLKKVKSAYQDVKFLYIKRRFKDVLNSYINMPGTKYNFRMTTLGKWLGAIKMCAQWSYENRLFQEIVERENGLTIEFEDLKEDFIKTIKKCCDYLGVICNLKQIKECPYVPNTSFIEKKKIVNFSGIELFVLEKLILKVFQKFPHIARILNVVWKMLKGKKCPLYWRILKSQYFLAELIEEFQKTGELDLVDYLDNLRKNT